jgi:outer membrane protein
MTKETFLKSDFAMKNNKKITVTGMMIVSVLAFMILAVVLTSQFYTPEKTGFVNNSVLFEGFEATKELEKKLVRIREQQQSVLDSLRISHDARQVNQEAAFIKQVAREFEINLAEQNEAFTNQAWIQINELVSEFGKANGYTFIHGAVGNGSLMYAHPEKNITTEVLEYINQRYEGL